MHIKHMQNQQKKLQARSDFYTPRGLHVYFKDPIVNEEIDVEAIVADLERKLPSHLLAEIEMIIFGWFDEFAERDINAFYDSGTIYISNYHDDPEEILDDIIHELAHSLEETYGYEIYADEKLKQEFIRKREYLYDILWKNDFKAPKAIFLDTEYNKEFDEFLYEKVGYDKLSRLLSGVFISAYAPTSLREYFATGFVTYYLDTNPEYLRKIGPQLYEKINLVHNKDLLDNRY